MQQKINFEKPKKFIDFPQITPKILRNWDSHKGQQLILGKQYVLSEKIGEGRSAEVYKIFKIDTQQPFVIKIIDYVKIRNLYNLKAAEKLIQKLDRQYELLKFCESPFVVRCFKVIRNSHFHCLILEYCNGMTLNKILVNSDFCLDQETVKKVARHVSAGIKALSLQNILHRDLTLDNIMESNGSYKIIDLGLGKNIKDQGEVKSIVGTKSMMAPEVMQRLPYGFKSDIYSLGMVILKITVKNYSFFQRTRQILNQNLLNSKNLPLNTDILDFLQKALKQKPEQRLSELQLLSHPLVCLEQNNSPSKNTKEENSDQTNTSQKSLVIEDNRQRYQSSISKDTLKSTGSDKILIESDVILLFKKVEFIIKTINLMERTMVGKEIVKNHQGIKLYYLLSKRAFSQMLQVWTYFYKSRNLSQIGQQLIQEYLSTASLKRSKYKRMLEKQINSSNYKIKQAMKDNALYKAFNAESYAVYKQELAVFFNSQDINKNDVLQNFITKFYIKKAVFKCPNDSKSLLKTSLLGYLEIVTMVVNEQSFDFELNKILQKHGYNPQKKIK